MVWVLDSSNISFIITVNKIYEFVNERTTQGAPATALVIARFATRTIQGEQPMTKLFLLPGGLICDAVGLTEDSDNRQILRMFLNTLIWGAAGVITILLLPF